MIWTIRDIFWINLHPSQLESFSSGKKCICYFYLYTITAENVTPAIAPLRRSYGVVALSIKKKSEEGYSFAAI